MGFMDSGPVLIGSFHVTDVAADEVGGDRSIIVYIRFAIGHVYDVPRSEGGALIVLSQQQLIL